MLETPVCRAVAEYSKRKTEPYVQSTRGLTSFKQNDNGEQEIHYVRQDPDVADATEKHQDRVKRKGTR